MEDLKDHYRACTACPVYCTNAPCPEVMTMSALGHHLGECKWSLMDCKFKHAGCNAHIYRSDMEKHLESNMKNHLDLLSKELKKLKWIEAKLVKDNRALYQTMQQNEMKMKKELKDRGKIQYLVVSDLPEDALDDELMLKSRFGMFGEVDDIVLEAGIVVYSSEDSYQRALDSSENQGIRLCGELLTVHPVYDTTPDN